VKYCGGCNPEYDRVSLVMKLERNLKEKARFVLPERKHVDMILAVQGCRTSCADLDPFGGVKTVNVTSMEDANQFISRVERDFPSFRGEVEIRKE
jgi:hypothetical protein